MVEIDWDHRGRQSVRLVILAEIDGGGGGPGGGVLSPFDGGGVRPEKKYRGVRELLFIPKKGGLEYWNKHRPKAVVREGVSPSCKGGLGGLTQKFCVI